MEKRKSVVLWLKGEPWWTRRGRNMDTFVHVVDVVISLWLQMISHVYLIEYCHVLARSFLQMTVFILVVKAQKRSKA